MKISTKDIERILEKMPKEQIEQKVSWGNCIPNYKEVVEVSSVMYHINKFIKEKQEK
jgi:hypothetical protein